MKLDHLFRGVNAVGFVANVVSMGLPYAHPVRLTCKSVSHFCNMASWIMLPGIFSDDKGKVLVSASTFFAFMADGDSMVRHSIEEAAVADEMTRYVRDGASAGIQLLNVIRGIDPSRMKDKPSWP